MSISRIQLWQNTNLAGVSGLPPGEPVRSPARMGQLDLHPCRTRGTRLGSVWRGLPCRGLGLFRSLALGRDLWTLESLQKCTALGSPRACEDVPALPQSYQSHCSGTKSQGMGHGHSTRTPPEGSQGHGRASHPLLGARPARCLHGRAFGCQRYLAPLKQPGSSRGNLPAWWSQWDSLVLFAINVNPCPALPNAVLKAHLFPVLLFQSCFRGRNHSS